MDLSAENWRAITATDRERLARRLAGELPSGFGCDDVRRHQLGSREHDVATFTFSDATFVLIPGGTVTVGYDADRPWEPNADEAGSWRQTADEYGIDRTIQGHVAAVTRRPARVHLPPILIETAADEVGWETIGTDDPEVRDIARRYGAGKEVQVHRGDTSTRVRPRPDGSTVAQRAVRLTHGDLAARLATAGFRFPTSDEWEYACGGGSETLFRWGDHVPCNRYPTDVSPAEAEYRRQWVRSRGTLERPAEGFVSDWDFHRQPNAFGLSIASDPYRRELTAEIGTTRGGDGGGTICGGEGFFVGWLTLATAYFEANACTHDPAAPISPGYTVGRRVLDLG